MKIAVSLVLVVLGVPRWAHAQRICEQGETELFISRPTATTSTWESARSKMNPARHGARCSTDFGDGNKAELVYPANAEDGAKKLSFSHAVRGTMYRVSVRFKSGDYTYLLESYGDDASDPPGNGAAGVTVTNASGRTVANITCIERPLIFPSYLRMALACDLGNPHGKAGCVEPPPHEKKAAGSRQ